MCLALIELTEKISLDPTNPFTFKSFEKARSEGMKCGIEQGRIQSFIESYQELGISLNETLLRLNFL